MSVEMDVIKKSKYAEFPDVITTLCLCRALAIKDGRKVIPAMRKCALNIRQRTENKTLSDALLTMSISAFPEVELNRMKAYLARMQSAIRREFRDVSEVL